MATMRSFLDLSTGTKQEQRGRVAIIKRGTKREQNPLAYNCGRNKARGWDKLSHPIWWGVGRLVEGGRKNYTHIHIYICTSKNFFKISNFFFLAFQLFGFSGQPGRRPASFRAFELFEIKGERCAFV